MLEHKFLCCQEVGCDDYKLDRQELHAWFLIRFPESKTAY